MEPDRKVSDSDIARNPILRQIAEEYARHYVGNAEWMIDCQEIVLEGNHLPTGLIRSALNTLRTDAGQSRLWAAASALLPVARLYSDTTPSCEVIPMTRPRRLTRLGRVDLEAELAKLHEVKTEPEHTRPYLKVFGVWKMPFATTTWKGATPRLHLVRRVVLVEWALPPDFSNNFDYATTKMRIFKPRPSALCSAGHELPYKSCWDKKTPKYKFWKYIPTMEEAHPEKCGGDDSFIPFCKSCITRYTERPEIAVWSGELP